MLWVGMGGHGWAWGHRSLLMVMVLAWGHRSLLMVMVLAWVQIRRKMAGSDLNTTSISSNDLTTPQYLEV
jgi:hypothetical protein